MNWTSPPERTTVPSPLSQKTPKPSPSLPRLTPEGKDGKPPESASDDIPDWVPMYPAKVENLSIKRREGGGQYGQFFFIAGPPDAVLTFYQTNLEMSRWEVTKKGEGALSAMNEGGSQSIVVTSEMASEHGALIYNQWKYIVNFSESGK